MTDRFWLWLHRYSARKAQRVYIRSPKYLANYRTGVANYRTGVAASQAKWADGIAAAPSSSLREPRS